MRTPKDRPSAEHLLDAISHCARSVLADHTNRTIEERCRAFVAQISGALSGIAETQDLPYAEGVSNQVRSLLEGRS